MTGFQKFRLSALGLVLCASVALGIAGSSKAQDTKEPDTATPPAAAPATAAPAPAATPAAAAPAAVPLATAPAEPIVPPTDPVAKAAFDTLDKHCARCHQNGKLVSRERPAKNFGNVLKLDEIAANPHLVLPGNPLGSKLFRQIADKEMPYDVNYEGETKYGTVSEADLKALESWITALGTKATASCESHKFIEPQDMVSFMVTDLDKQLKQRQSSTRYLTLTHLANICADPKAMDVYRQAAIKFLNSLGRSSDVVKLEAIDPEQTILRFNLIDLGWSTTDWDNIIAIYPYNVQPESEFSKTLASATKTPMPYVRADWFAFTASQPPLYDDLLKLGATFQIFAKDQGIDLTANIANFVAQRAAFQKSGVSQNNRLIERHPSRSGYFWTSYDFAGNRDHQSLFDFPLGPSADGFHHDGGETIFSLPNGFQGYYLNRSNGERLDKGPVQIVRDPSRKDFSVTNGISCMGCHDQGMRKAKDDIRDLVLKSKSFPKEVRDAVEGLYPPHDKMDALIASDAQRFADAMKRANLDPTLKLNGIEMINALAKRYEDDLDLTLAAAELGLEKKEFQDESGDVDGKFKPLIRRLAQGAIPRDQWEKSFIELAPEITDLQVVKIAGATPPKPLTKPVGNKDDLSLTSDQDSYKVGDAPIFTIVAPRDCYLTLTDIDERGEGNVLLPNSFQQDNFIRAGKAIQFPAAGAPFQFRMKDRGTETVTAVCAVQAAGGDSIQHDFKKNQFTPVQNYTTTVARSISVVAAGSAPPAVAGVTNSGNAAAGGPREPPPEGSRGSFRAAIKVQVR
jgi:hypothetical protein